MSSWGGLTATEVASVNKTTTATVNLWGEGEQHKTPGDGNIYYPNIFTPNNFYSNQYSKNQAAAGYLWNPLTGVYLAPRGIDWDHYKDNYEVYDPARGCNVQNWTNTELPLQLSTVRWLPTAPS